MLLGPRCAMFWRFCIFQKSIEFKQIGLRTGLWGQSFSLSCSLNLFWLAWLFRILDSTDSGEKLTRSIPTPDFCVMPSRRESFSRSNRSLDVLTYLPEVRGLCKWESRGISPEVGSTNFQPIMFDMEWLVAKRFLVPSTRNQVLVVGVDITVPTIGMIPIAIWPISYNCKLWELVPGWGNVSSGIILFHRWTPGLVLGNLAFLITWVAYFQTQSGNDVFTTPSMYTSEAS